MNKKLRAFFEKTRSKIEVSAKLISDVLFSPRLSQKEQIHFAKRLSYLVSGGVHIVESLTILKKQNRTKSKILFYDTIISEVSSGQYLSTSLGRFKNIFNDFAVNIIRVGEESGILNQNLNYLAEELKKKQALRQKIVSAMIYPVFISIATLGLTLLLTVFVFPKILPIFRSLRVKIPFTTQVLISVSQFLHSYGILFFFALAFVIFILTLLFRTARSFHFVIDKTVLSTPFLGKLVQSFNMANFCRTLGLLLQSGIVLPDALAITSETTTNLVFREALTELAQSVLKGNRISSYLETREKIFPDMMAHMIAVGETTGNLSETLLYLSNLYESEVDDITKNLSSAVEPILMILMGLMIGVVAVSVISPIYEITQNLHVK